MEIRPIKNDKDHERTLLRVEQLWGSAPGSPRGDELDVLVTLIEAYEKRTYPIDLPSPIDAIKFRLEQQGKDFSALIGVIGQRTRVYEVMRGDRPLSLNMIRKLHSKLKIPAEVLIQAAGPSKPRKHRPKSGRAGKSLRKSA